MIAGVWLIDDGQIEVSARSDSHPIPAVSDPRAQALPPLATRGELSRLLSRVRAARSTGRTAFVWVDLLDPTMREMALLADVFQLPSLQVEDALSSQQRPKLERTSRLFAVVRAVTYTEATSDIETHQVSAFLGSGYLLTVSHGRYDIADAMHTRLNREPSLRRNGASAALYALFDTVADQYLEVASEIANDIEQIEESVFSPERTDDSADIYELKRENLELRRAVAPLATAASMILRGTMPQIKADLQPYFSDVADHVLRAADLTESHDQLLMTMLMASTARHDLQQNADMRRISAWAAMGVAPTLIAGIYGMNFQFMPELDEWWGYPFALGLMGLVVLMLHRAFKRAGWL